ncbi:MAG: BCAM0308 family protein [Deltaproteobacteria bacterium]|nr:BCAM0308 family protein [Deltaproteobacteria bacterium]
MSVSRNFSKSTRKKAIDTAKDPYIAKLGDVDAMCTVCSALYTGKRWRLASLKDMEKKARYKKVVCPACRKIRDNFAAGYVTLSGGFVDGHRNELLGLVKNKEARAMYTNPLERIIETRVKKGSITITTTTEKLAQRIGQMVTKAFSGEIEYKWSSDTKIARVYWTRER